MFLKITSIYKKNKKQKTKPKDTKKPAFVVQNFQLVHHSMCGNVKDNFVYLLLTQIIKMKTIF